MRKNVTLTLPESLVAHAKLVLNLSHFVESQLITELATRRIDYGVMPGSPNPKWWHNVTLGGHMLSELYQWEGFIAGTTYIDGQSMSLYWDLFGQFHHSDRPPTRALKEYSLRRMTDEEQAAWNIQREKDERLYQEQKAYDDRLQARMNAP